MNNIFKIVVGTIIGAFVRKSLNKLTGQSPARPDPLWSDAQVRVEARRAAARPVVAKLDAVSTPLDGTKLMAAIGSISDMEAVLRPGPRGCTR